MSLGCARNIIQVDDAVWFVNDGAAGNPLGFFYQQTFVFLIFKCDDRACLYMPLCGPVIQSQIKIVAKNNDPTELLSDDLQSHADLNI